ncbi:MAG: DUF1080 domain-containing protein [Bacteroidaceae bacterium]|nr:DUF1080 domain-containing protein [Bacteroidaceae bacterium]MCF0185730.1 DUF1080 domain-containing protein [Bacteroidaceae bacterium]
MKKVLFYSAAMCLAMGMASCGSKTAAPAAEPAAEEEGGVPAYTEMNKPEVDLSTLKQDAEGYYMLFDGTSLDGWRGYGKDVIPERWSIEDGCLTFNGTGLGEGQTLEGGDIIFNHKFQNFTLEFEWKVDKGSNSGVFFMAREIQTKNENGEDQMEPIYISAPEYQILDNANHPDAKLGKDGNRMSASLYDMIPAKPQNQKPFGEWNTGSIMCYKGTVVHSQNGENVVEYHLWTKQWTEMLQASKFSEEKWPLAFELLNNLGGENHAGFIGFQDHGDRVQFRNIRVKVMD